VRNLLCGLTVLLAAGFGARADAVFNSEAAWAAALTGSPTTVNFEGIEPVGGYSAYGFGPGASVAVGGLNFAIGPAGNNNILFIMGDGNYSPPAFFSAQPTDGVEGDVLITLPGVATALGFDFGSVFVAGTATVTLSDGSVESVAAPASPDLAFFGVTAPGGITSVDITLSDSNVVGGIVYGIDVPDVSYGTASVPEPSSVILLFTMLLAIAVVARKRIAQRL